MTTLQFLTSSTSSPLPPSSAHAHVQAMGQGGMTVNTFEPSSSWLESLTYVPSISTPHEGIFIVMVTDSPSCYLYQVPSWLPGLVLAGVYSDTCQRRSVGRAYVKRVKMGGWPHMKVTRDEVEALLKANANANGGAN